MPAKDTIYFTKQQIERLIELYQGEENLWNIGSPDYHKKNKKNDSLEKMKMALEEEFQDIQPYTGILQAVSAYVSMRESTVLVAACHVEF